jgi:adenylate kinase
MGAPGAGKGTQAEAIIAEYGIPAISTGEIFRRNVAAGTPLGVRAQHIMASGGYIDDEITNAVVAERLAEDDASDGFLLDGYPRTLPQVAALDEMLAGQSTELTAVVVLVADPEVVTSRLLARARQQGRADDTAEAIRTRQQVYERETAPVLTTYRERRLLLEVDAHGPRDDVTQRTLAALETSTRVQL